MIQFDLPQNNPSNIIKVIGVGGGGGNAVNYMYNLGIDGVDFVVCNTDKKALNNSPVPVKVQLGPSLTQGLGAGAQPEIGQKACMESISEIENLLSDNTKMVFVTAGMGGGTGTGGAPIVAQTAKNLGILTVGIVTTPFSYEGRKRIRQADEGIEALRKNVDTILVISNDKLRQQFGNIATSQAFNRADDILATATKCITDVINSQGHIVVDFADVSTVMRDGGVAILGNATAAGENRAYEAAEQALNSPLLNDSNIHGAKWVLLNINSAHGVHEHTLDEVEMIQAYIQEQAGEDCDVIFGTGFDDNLGENISVTIIATGFEYKQIQDAYSSERKTPKADSNRITLKLGEAGEEHKLFGNPTEEQVQNTPPVNQIMDIVQTEIEAPAIPNYMAIGLGMSRIAATAVPVQEEVQDFMYEEKVIDTLGFTTEFELPEYHAMAEDIPTSVYEEEWVMESTDALPLADTEMAIPDESTEEIPAEEPFMESLAVLEEEPEVVALSEETAETLEEEPKLIFELSI
ncbi:MAG TPA: cell division protein FtsZ, partial [Chitinophagaceae bacterium]|nr:cell division protein FtsZ [Chitinophagaceae bacterium]